MANSSVTFSSRGTRIFHGKAFGAIPVCRFVSRALVADVSLHGGQVTLCTTASVPCGVSPATFADGDDMDYHRSGIAAVECDGSTLSAATIGDYVKSTATGTACVEGTPGTPTAFTAGVQLSYDATTHIADIELSF
jgi:hypothetical protein